MEESSRCFWKDARYINFVFIVFSSVFFTWLIITTSNSSYRLFDPKVPYTWNYWQVKYLLIHSKMQLARF